jgi:hypothetical protein
MDDKQASFQFRDLLDRFLRGWIWVVLFGALGAVIGFSISLILPPTYEAAASILVNIDYGRTEPLELVVEDRILDRVWYLIISEETYLQTIEKLNASKGNFDAWASVEALRENTRLDARLSKWELIGVHSNPEIAVLIANTWQEVVLDRLDEAMEHAWRAQTLQGATFDVACVEMLIAEKLDDIMSCVIVKPEVDPGILTELREEITKSHGLLPNIHYEFFQNASTPESPVLWPRGILIFSGSMIGFILSLLRLILPKNIMETDIQNYDPIQSISGKQKQ